MNLYTELLPWLEKTFPPSSLKDAGYNGLQIFSQETIKKIGFAVSSNERTLETAKELGIDTLLVHHGLFWGSQFQPLTGLLGRRIQKCYKSNINLLAYHLPLDIHPLLGNNTELGRLLGWNSTAYDPFGLVRHTTIFASPDRVLKTVQKHFTDTITVTHSHLLEPIDRDRALHIGWCTGAGGDLSVDGKFDLFISGEYCERHYDQALEQNTVLVSIGHYASERLGILALKNAFEIDFSDVECHFIEQWSPW